MKMREHTHQGNKRTAAERRRGMGGATLIELICALSVAATGIFGGIHVYMQGLESLRAFNEYEVALCAINNELETLRALPWTQLVPVDNAPFLSDTSGLEQLHLAETRATIAETDLPGLKRVEVRVRWVGEKGRVMEKRLVTLVADMGAARHE